MVGEKSCSNWGLKICSSTSYLARMVDESCNPTFTGGINNMLPVNLKEITGTLILLSFSRLVFDLSFVSNLNYFDEKLQNEFIC